MTSEGEYNTGNPLLPLCEKQKQLLTKSLGVILAACAIAFLVTESLVRISALQWVWIIDVAAVIYYKVSYRTAVKKFDPNISTPPQAYSQAKNRQYAALVSCINVNSVVAVLCPAGWVIFVAFALWLVLFLSMPKMTDLKKDFGYEDL